MTKHERVQKSKGFVLETIKSFQNETYKKQNVWEAKETRIVGAYKARRIFDGNKN